MEKHFVEIDFAPNPEALLARLHIDADSDEAGDFLELVDKAKKIARPKAVFMRTAIESNDPSGVVIMGGERFVSRVLSANLKDAKEAWPHVATCGREVYDFAMAIADPFERYWCDEIMEAALADVRVAMLQAIEKAGGPGKVSVMSPGSLTEWPIQEQTPLFRLLGDAPGKCGVELTDAMLMVPNKSISGVLFHNENGWESCVMCPRDKCPNRRAKYNPDALAELDA